MKGFSLSQGINRADRPVVGTPDCRLLYGKNNMKNCIHPVFVEPWSHNVPRSMVKIVIET